MRRTSFWAVLGILAALPGNLAWGQANLPNNPNAVTIQGPDPTGQQGYPLATVPATGALPWPVAIQSFAASLCVTQCTSPWVTDPVGINHSAVQAMTAANQAATVACGNASSAAVTMVADGSWLGIVIFEATTNGSDWHELAAALTAENIGTSGLSGYQAAITNQAQNSTALAQIAVGGFTYVRARCLFRTAGTLTVALNVSAHGISPLPSLPALASQALPGYLPSFGLMNVDLMAPVFRVPPCVQSGQPFDPSIGAYPPISWSINSAQTSPTTQEALRSPAVFKTVATAAAGNTAVWTPAAGKRFRLMRYMVTVTDQATQAAPGTLSISLFDGAAGVTGQVHDVFVPALGLVNTGSLYSSGWIDLGNGYLSTAANNVLNINLSAALTAGTVRVICCGTEE